MIFSCDRGELNAAIQTVIKAVPPKNPMQILEGILVEVTPGNVKMTGYDMKKAIFTSFEANVMEVGNLVLDAKMLSNIISSFPAGEVTIQSDGMNVQIKSGKSKFSLVGMDSGDYPELPEVDGTEGISLPQGTLGKMIRQTIFAVSDNESRPVYTGELFEIENGQLAVVATDGYRLSLRRENVENVEQDCKFVVPGNSLSDLEKLCGDVQEPVHILLGERHISFSLGNTVLISRRLDGEFMNYKGVIPQSFSVVVTADKAELQHSIQRVSLVIDDRVKVPLRCIFDDDSIHFSGRASTGAADDYCQADGDGNGLEIGFNNRYLLDALKAAYTDEVAIKLNSASTPGIITPADGSDKFVYMILPVRLKVGNDV